MTDPKFQAAWHALNQAQVTLVIAHDESDKSERRKLLSESQEQAKRADVLVREILSAQVG